MQEDEKIINDLKNCSEEALQYLYENYRQQFIKWATYNYHIGVEEAEDIYSDAIIDVYQNIRTGKYIKQNNSSLKSYLFEVGKYKILNLINKKKLNDVHHQNIYHLNVDKRQDSPEVNQFSEDLAIKVKELMNLLDDKCKEVLTLYYFYNLSMEKIAEKMDFKNDDVSKNKKLKCLRKLQELTFERYEKADFF